MRQESGKKFTGRVIYILSDPRTGEVRYVGKTGGDYKKRLYEHLWVARVTHISSAQYKWLRALLAVGEQPQAQVIDWCETDKEAYSLEREWMRYYQQLGAKLTNRIPKIKKPPCRAQVDISPFLYEKIREEFGPGPLAEHIRRILEERYAR